MSQTTCFTSFTTTYFVHWTKRTWGRIKHKGWSNEWPKLVFSFLRKIQTFLRILESRESRFLYLYIIVSVIQILYICICICICDCICICICICTFIFVSVFVTVLASVFASVFYLYLHSYLYQRAEQHKKYYGWAVVALRPLIRPNTGLHLLLVGSNNTSSSRLHHHPLNRNRKYIVIRSLNQIHPESWWSISLFVKIIMAFVGWFINRATTSTWVAGYVLSWRQNFENPLVFIKTTQTSGYKR